MAILVQELLLKGWEGEGRLEDQEGQFTSWGTSEFCLEIASHFKSVNIIAVIQCFANCYTGIAS